MELRSSAYRAGGEIPRRYTCDGDDVSPSFRWKDAPQETKSFVLLLHDPDAAREGGFTHWIVYDIVPVVHQIDENTPKQAPFTAFGVQGNNDGNQLGYIVPRPTPKGSHRYIARLFSLDIELELGPGAGRQQVEAAMEGHILDQAALIGKYGRKTRRKA